MAVTWVVRDAREGDAAAIAAILNDAIGHSTAVWDETPVDVAGRLAWLEDHRRPGCAVLVATDARAGHRGEVLGYGAFGPWRAREGYRHTVEHSVYVRADQRGRGIGRTLMGALVDRARTEGLHVMVAGIESGNAASIRLHESLGFTHVGHLPQVGAKFGRWLDLDFLQLVLDQRETPPLPGSAASGAGPTGRPSDGVDTAAPPSRTPSGQCA